MRGTNDAALAAMAKAGPHVSIAKPARAGPSTRARLKESVAKPAALARPSAPARLAANERRVACERPLPTPSSKAKPAKTG